MTCITGMVRNGDVYMAGDLMGSNGFTGRVYPDSKVFTNGDFIIGYTSSFRMGQILEWNWEPPLRQEGITDRNYMQLNVVESLRATFATYGYGVKEGLEDIGGNFLIGYKGCLYEMQNNFSLLSIPDYAAVGSGQYHAEAVLHLLTPDEEIHPFDIMQAAIGTAAHFTQSVSFECTMFSSNENAQEEWEGEELPEGGSEGDGVVKVLDKEYVESVDDIDELKDIANNLLIHYNYNIGASKLKKRILACLEETEE